MSFKVGDVVALKSSPDVKMTVRDLLEDGTISCDWFNKQDGTAYMSRAEFKPEQLSGSNA